MNYETIKLRLDGDICFIQINRPAEENAINTQLINEFSDALQCYRSTVKILVLEGLPDVFCSGADFDEIAENRDAVTDQQQQNAERLYEVWQTLATGPFISVAHVRGKTNAGGVGFVAACDVVICNDAAVFSLPELLFGLMPACVLPFLAKRVGGAKANYMTLTTQPVTADQAYTWGLVDLVAERSEGLLKRQISRLRLLDKSAIARYRQFAKNLDDSLARCKAEAVGANLTVFSNRENLDRIARYVATGQFPWEGR